MTLRNRPIRLFILLGIGFFAVSLLAPRSASAATRKITFPVIGKTSFGNDFGNPRVGHTHAGNDIFGKKMQPLVAAVDGTLEFVAYPEPSYGWYIRIVDADGYTYSYIHINNDTPGTDNGRGGATLAYAPGVERSWPVVAGQVIAYMGDSGNAESTSPHLHFEIRKPDDTAINPYDSLKAAKKITRAAIAPTLSFEILPFAQFRVGSNIAMGDIAPEYDGDEIVVGAGVGSPPQVRIMTPAGFDIGGFFLSQRKGRGGVDVAIGDVNGDGVKEIVTGLGPKNDPLVQVVDRHGTVLASFLAYGKAFRGGVRVSTADLDGDGVDEIITGAGRGGGPEVRVFRMNGDIVSVFDAYPNSFHGGVDVAGISASATQTGLIVVTPGAGSEPQVRVFTMHGNLTAAFLSGDATFRGGLRVTTSISPTTNEASIYTVPMSHGHGIIRQHDQSGNIIVERDVFERWWMSGFDVAVSQSTIYTASAINDRRGSIMITTPQFPPYPYGFSR